MLVLVIEFTQTNIVRQVEKRYLSPQLLDIKSTKLAA